MDQLSAPEYERLILGISLTYPAYLPLLADRLRGLHFEGHAHRQLWAAVLSVYQRGAPVDVMTVAAALDPADLGRLGGIAGLAGLYDGSSSPDNHEEVIRVLDDRASRRRIYSLAEKMRSAAFDPSEEGKLLAMRARVALDSEDRLWNDSTAACISDVIDALAAQIEGGVGETVEITSGFPAIDKATLGISRRDMWILGGRPGSGKTAWSLRTAVSNAKRGKRVLFRSLEQPTQRLVQRILAQETGIEFLKIRQPITLSEMEKRNLAITMADLQRLLRDKLIVDDNPEGNDYRDICSWVRREHQLRGCDLFVLDHIQETTGPEGSRREQVVNAGGAFKSLAKSLGIGALILSQVPNPAQGAKDFRPHLWQLMDGGGMLAAKGDLISFIHREVTFVGREAMEAQGQDPNIAEWIVRKNRDGWSGTILQKFEGESVRFR